MMNRSLTRQEKQQQMQLLSWRVAKPIGSRQVVVLAKTDGCPTDLQNILLNTFLSQAGDERAGYEVSVHIFAPTSRDHRESFINFCHNAAVLTLQGRPLRVDGTGDQPSFLSDVFHFKFRAVGDMPVFTGGAESIADIETSIVQKEYSTTRWASQFAALVRSRPMPESIARASLMLQEAQRKAPDDALRVAHDVTEILASEEYCVLIRGRLVQGDSKMGRPMTRDSIALSRKVSVNRSGALVFQLTSHGNRNLGAAVFELIPDTTLLLRTITES